MALTRQDCVVLVREIEGLLREYDPGSLDLVVRSTERDNDPRRYVVRLLRTITKVYSERSGGMAGPILNTMNHFVRLADDSPIRGISVALSPAERELYDTDEINLAELPDRSEFLAELNRITADIQREAELPEDQQ
jgi:hypothetical protein